MVKLRNFSGRSLVEEASRRREWLEKRLGVSLKSVGGGLVDEGWKGKNVENLVGTAQVPLGVAGPVDYKITGKKGVFRDYLPLATTEGALVASVSRGCRAINEGGGARVVVEDLGMTRAPVFCVAGVEEGRKIEEWIKVNLKKLKVVVRGVDERLELISTRTFLVGRNLYVRLVCDTGEAMGMNMVTIGAQRAVEFLERKFGVKCVALSGNVCTDKKLAGINWVLGRGKRVWVEVALGKDVVGEVLKSTPEEMVEVNARKTLMGSVMAGASGFNAQAANVVAAMFLATGQDLAHVAHGADVVTAMEVVGGGLCASVYVSGLPVGTVGGGTGGPTQRESLGLLGLDKARRGDGERLAGVIGVGVLAGEVSLHAALAGGDLARAHARLGRGRAKG